MSKILKNNSGASIDISDTGITIDNATQYTIPPVDYLLWAGSSNAVTEIGAGKLVVNDGSDDLSISDGVDLIKGIFPKNVDEPIKAPYIDSSLVRTIQNFASTQMPRSNQPYLDFFSINGKGALSSFVLKLGSEKVTIKLSMDGATIFETNVEDLDDFDDTGIQTSWLSWNGEDKRIVFKPSSLIRFISSIQISIKSNENKDKNFNGYIVDYLEG